MYKYIFKWLATHPHPHNEKKSFEVIQASNLLEYNIAVVSFAVLPLSWGVSSLYTKLLWIQS